MEWFPVNMCLFILILLHLEGPKPYGVLALLSAIGLNLNEMVYFFKCLTVEACGNSNMTSITSDSVAVGCTVSTWISELIVRCLPKLHQNVSSSMIVQWMKLQTISFSRVYLWLRFYTDFIYTVKPRLFEVSGTARFSSNYR